MAKNKTATFDELVAASTPTRKTISVGKFSIVVQELSGADRFELAARADENRWDLMRWVCLRGMVEPAVQDLDDLDKLKPEWVLEIATAITDLSGVSEESATDAEKGSAAVSVIGGS